MTISHTQTLLLLLSLFFLPASHGMDFEYCNGSGYDSISVTGVKSSSVGPNNTTTISIAGSTTGGSLRVNNVVVDFRTTGEDDSIFYTKYLYINEVCTKTRCPFVSSTFELNIPLLSSPFLPPVDYKIEISLLFFATKEIVALCVAMNLPASSSPSISSA
ncbi:unnamed protein product [Microthlaspi erraticum]|uniref:Uncharacterized protein n=1 Tax=Microthlaspi erraticum TaxID=1685480 RepID=A0A6D2JLP1_9BRAS|nr:unnamed protein product [Microthlaspi erraticum]